MNGSAPPIAFVRPMRRESTITMPSEAGGTARSVASLVAPSFNPYLHLSTLSKICLLLSSRTCNMPRARRRRIQRLDLRLRRTLPMHGVNYSTRLRPRTRGFGTTKTECVAVAGAFTRSKQANVVVECTLAMPSTRERKTTEKRVRKVRVRASILAPVNRADAETQQVPPMTRTTRDPSTAGLTTGPMRSSSTTTAMGPASTQTWTAKTFGTMDVTCLKTFTSRRRSTQGLGVIAVSRGSRR